MTTIIQNVPIGTSVGKSPSVKAPSHYTEEDIDHCRRELALKEMGLRKEDP